MSEPFLQVIRDALVRHASLDEFVETLRVHRNLGLTQEDAYQALEALRSGATEDDEDRILEWMDVVAGFCQPSRRVWPTTLSR